MTDMKRRLFLKGSVAVGAVGAGLASGLFTPRAVLADWSESAFHATKIPAALNGLFGTDTTEVSDAIQIKAPDIAENGAVVPVTVKTDLEDVSHIVIIAAANATPLVADFELSELSVPFVATRIKMGKTADVVAVVKAGGKLYSARKAVKVTIGGCGG